MSTEYKINTTDGKTFYKVTEGNTNYDLPIALIGHGQPVYGEDQNKNFLHLLENFASPEAPSNAIIGQLWFKKLSKNDSDKRYELCVCKDTTKDEEKDWDKIAIVYTNAPQTPSNGELWYDSESHSLKIYDDTMGDTTDKRWNVIGPTDAVHKQTKNDAVIIRPEQGTNQTIYTIDQSLFQQNIDNKEDKEKASGSLNLVTLKILAKEIFNTPPRNKTPRSAAWIYKFLINAYEVGENQYSIQMVGRENYELIGITDNTDWTVEMFKSGSDFIFRVQDNSGVNLTDSRIVVGFDLDIVRV